MPLDMEVGLGPCDFVLDGDPAPLPKNGAEPTNFRPVSIAAKRLHRSRCHLVWTLEVGLGPRHIVLDGEPAPLPKKGAEPPISAHFYCRQLDTEVDLGPGHIVLHGS